MIKTVTVINHVGESLVLDLANPYDIGIALLSMDGLGAGKASVNTTELATMDGSIFNSARVDSRNITMELKFLWDGSVETNRQKSYRYFPLKRKVTLVIETDNRVLGIDGYVESNEVNIFSDSERANISIICPEPFFYSAGDNPKNTTVFSGVEPKFEFPFSNESLSLKTLVFGDIQNKTENVVPYDGDSDVGVEIYIHAVGDASGIAIYNVNTREIMRIDSTKLASLTGHDIQNGDDIRINTNKGRKSITLERDGVITNILNCLAKDVDWFRVVKGDNIFAYTATNGAENLQFIIDSQILYEGV